MDERPIEHDLEVDDGEDVSGGGGIRDDVQAALHDARTTAETESSLLMVAARDRSTASSYVEDKLD